MAKGKHLALIKQGLEVWNQWRLENLHIRPDLSGANLRGVVLSEVGLITPYPTMSTGAYLAGANLSKADFSGANLSWAILNEANLEGAKLDGADFSAANLDRANLYGANLYGTNLSRADLTLAKLSAANLSRANLSRAKLTEANLSRANLSGADLSEATLAWANLSGTDLSGANFSRARILYTIFGDVDLRGIQGLETVEHQAPSTIGIDTLHRSKDNLPKIFLQRAGVPDDLINYFERTETPSTPYSSEQIDYWFRSLQKRLAIITKNIARLEEKKAMAGPIDVPLRILNELDECETEREKVEAWIAEFQKIKDVYY